MKKIEKAKNFKDNQIKRAMNELKFMRNIESKFVVSTHYAFQDKLHLYLVMDLMPGGDLRFHIQRNRNKVTMYQAQFAIACLIQALEGIHKHNIIHKDVKPKNLVFDSVGYLKLTGFRFSTAKKSLNMGDGYHGAPNWTAPEVLCKRAYSFQADYWAVGIIAYQLMMGGEVPYKGQTDKEIIDAQLGYKVNIKTKDIPANWSWQAADFINKCLQ